MRRPLATFLASGALLALLRAVVFPVPATPNVQSLPPRVVIEAAHVDRIVQAHVRATGREPSTEEREAIVEGEVRDRLLLRAALDSGLDRIDPRINWRLMEKMRFLGKADESDPAATVRHARALGLHEHDVVIERMLIEKVGTLARYRVQQADDVGEAELETFYREHADRWRHPRRTTLRHLFFGGDPVGGRDDAERALATIVATARERDPQLSMGLPFVAGSRHTAADDAALAKLFGGEFASAVATLPQGIWSGPVRSASGWHLVLVAGRDGERPAAFSEVRRRVLAAFQAERGDRALHELVEELRRTYEVAIEPAGEDRSASHAAARPNDA